MNLSANRCPSIGVVPLAAKVVPKGHVYLIQEDGLSQSDLLEVGTQSVISEIPGGKRQLNVRHIRALSDRFGVSADVFF